MAVPYRRAVAVDDFTKQYEGWGESGAGAATLTTFQRIDWN